MTSAAPFTSDPSPVVTTSRRHLFDRPIGVLAMLVALLVLGAMTLPSMRINLMPPGLTAPLVFVNMNMDTESSTEALEAVTRPAEEILRALPGVDYVSSSTRGGRVRLMVGPAPGITLTMLATRIGEALDNNRHRLPTVRRPLVGTWSESDPPMVAAAIDSGNFEEEAFREIIERELVPALMRVPGVAKVVHNLEGEGSILLAFEPDRVAANKTNLNKLMTHLGSATPKAYVVPVRRDGVRREEIVRVRSGDLTHSGLEDVRLDNTVQLGEVAAVAALPANYGRWVDVDGRPGCVLSVYPTPDANSYGASGMVTQVLQREAKRLGLKAIQQGSTHQQIDAATDELLLAGIWGGAFSVLFLVLFLGRVRLALLVCAALPLSLALAVLAMACHDNTLNLFSLMGFLLATGMVIDNAIVVGEALLRVRECADPAERAAALRRAVRGVAMAIVVSTLTTIALFLPMVVTSNGWIRVLMMAIGEPITWSLLGSLVVALVLVPMAFPRLYPRGLMKRGQRRGHARWLIATERFYGRLLAWFLLRPLMGVLLVAAVVVPGVAGWWLLPEKPVGEEEDNRVLSWSARVRGNPRSEEVTAAFAAWQRELAPHYQRLGIVSVIADYQLDRGELRIHLVPIDPLRRHENVIEEDILGFLSPQLAVALDKQIERASSQAVKLPDEDAEKKKKDKETKDGKDEKAAAAKPGDKSTPGKSGDGKSGDGKRGDRKRDRPQSFGWEGRLSFRLIAPDEQAIDDAWIKLRTVLANTDGVVNPGPTLAETSRDIELAMSGDAEERGWRADQLSGQVTRFGGTRQITTMPDGWGLRVGPLERTPRTLDRLMGVEVRDNAGGADRLENLVRQGEAATQSEIRRRDGLSQRDFWITVDPQEKARLRDALPELLAKADVAPGTQIALSFWEQRAKDDTAAWLIAFILAGTIIFLLMGVLYESVLAPLALMTTVPLVFFAVHALFKAVGLPIDGMVNLGSFLLIGIVINHGVVLIDRISGSVPMHRLDHGNHRTALLAVAAAARRRFSPVVLTSLVTIAGALPMAFGHGRLAGAVISGLGASLAIGMACALLFTLLVVPLVYRWLAGLRTGLLRLAKACLG